MSAGAAVTFLMFLQMGMALVVVVVARKVNPDIDFNMAYAIAGVYLLGFLFTTMLHTALPLPWAMPPTSTQTANKE